MNIVDWNCKIRNKCKEDHHLFLEIHMFIISSSSFPEMLRTNVVTSPGGVLRVSSDRDDQMGGKN